MIKERLYSPKDAAEILGVCTLTIKRWDKAGKINTLRTPNGRRRIAQSEINRLLNIDASHEEISDKDTIAVYARVSSHEQKVKGDLDRQIGALVNFINIKKQGVSITTITDVGSGLNDKRKGLMKLMELAKDKKFSEINITYKDRLTRFGFNYLEMYFKSYGVPIIIMNNDGGNKNPQDELVEDLISVITSFSEKLYGLRSGKNKIVNNKVTEIIKLNLEE